MRRKARFVTAGCVACVSQLEVHSSAVKSMIMIKILTVAQDNGLKFMGRDTANALPLTPTIEKLCTIVRK